MYLSRDIETKLLEASKEFYSITIYGPRQVGKSTLLVNLFKDIKYVSLDDLQIREYANRDPKGFLSFYKTPLIIDEIQKVPSLLEYIKLNIDNRKNDDLRLCNNEKSLMYILSGSNQFELQKAVVDSLAGRTCVFNLSSLSFNEIKQRSIKSFFNPDIDTLLEKEKLINNSFRSRKEIFEDIFKGGMPEYVLNSMNRDMFFNSYVSTYIEKDVKRVIAVDKETTFMSFMKYLALRTGCCIDYNDISNSVGIDARTVKGWISILEASGIIVLIHPYSPNASNRIIKSSKLYFMDTGLCSYLCGIPSSDILEASAFAGSFYETYVVSEIVKSYFNSYKNIENIYYYRDRDQHEVDLIIDCFDSIYPIEIKKGINPVNSNKRFTVLKKFNKKINKGLILNSGDKILPINDEVYYCPIDLIGL